MTDSSPLSEADSVSLLCDVNGSRGDGSADRTDPQSHSAEEQDENATPADMCSFSKSAAGNVLRVGRPRKALRRNEKGETLLHRASRMGQVGRVRALIGDGVSVNDQDYAGWTCLHEAAAHGHQLVVQELLRAGAHLDVRSWNGVTPLHDAVFSGHYEVVELLLRFGSDGISALDVAKEDKMRELLLTFQPSSVTPEHLQVSRAASRPGQRSEVSNQEQWRASGEPGVRGSSAVELRGSVAIRALLDEMDRKQRDMSSWPLTRPEDAVRYWSAVTQIHSLLKDLLSRQRAEKINVELQQRNLLEPHRTRFRKLHLMSLASRQRFLVLLLQNQRTLAARYLAVMTKHPERQQPTGTSISSAGSVGSSWSNCLAAEAHTQKIRASSTSCPSAAQQMLSDRVREERSRQAPSCQVLTQTREPAARHQNGTSPGGSRQLKVTFRDRRQSLSVLGVDAEGDAAHTRLQDVHHFSTWCASGHPSSVGSASSCLRQLLTLQSLVLLRDDELLPNAMVDLYWGDMD